MAASVTLRMGLIPSGFRPGLWSWPKRYNPVTWRSHMRFGLVGTGFWATIAHGPGLLAAEGVELIGVWGQHATQTSELANQLEVAKYDDYSALLEDVDAVAFAVPP